VRSAFFALAAIAAFVACAGALIAANARREPQYVDREAKLHFFAHRRERLQNIAEATYTSYCLRHRGLARITLVEPASNRRVVVVTIDELYDVIVSGRKRAAVVIDCADGMRRVDRGVTVAPEWRKKLLQEAAVGA
jgi:hypothetical protein